MGKRAVDEVMVPTCEEDSTRGKLEWERVVEVGYIAGSGYSCSDGRPGTASIGRLSDGEDVVSTYEGGESPDDTAVGEVIDPGVGTAFTGGHVDCRS